MKWDEWLAKEKDRSIETLSDLRGQKQPWRRRLRCFLGFHDYRWLNSWEYNPNGRDFRTRACICCPRMYDTTDWSWDD